MVLSKITSREGLHNVSRGVDLNASPPPFVTVLTFVTDVTAIRGDTPENAGNNVLKAVFDEESRGDIRFSSFCCLWVVPELPPHRGWAGYSAGQYLVGT